MIDANRVSPSRARRQALLPILLALLVLPDPASAQSCVGDCDGDGQVLVHELLLGVNIVLEQQPVSACQALADDEGMVTISQLMQGVLSALGSCVPLPSPSPTPTPTSEPFTPTVTPSVTAASPTASATVAPPATSTATAPAGATSTATVSPTVEAGVCGDGTVDEARGETCDDGNTDDGDACPSDCRIETCDGPPQGTLTVEVNIATMPGDLTLSDLTLLLSYPERRVSIPGTGNEPSVQAHVASPAGFTVAPIDLDYALRSALDAPSPAGIGAGTALTARFDICAGQAVPVARDFRCTVEGATGSSGSVTEQVTCAIRVRPAELPLVCGDGIVNLAGGETCDDGNTDDGDSCPATCRIEPCAEPSQGRLTVLTQFAGMPPDLTLAGMTLELDYPEGRVTLPGTANDASVQARVASPAGFSLTPNDLDYLLRAVLLDPSLSGIASGTALSVDFDICAGEAVPVARDFHCRIVDATAIDDEGVLVDASDDVTCSIVVQPPDLPEVCGDGIVNLAGGETCDDGNTDDGDSCPSTCRIEPCAEPPQGTLNVRAQFAGMPTDLTVAGMTLEIDYPEERVTLPGTANDAAVQARVASPAGFSVTPNDLDYLLRTVLLDPLLSGIGNGTAVSMEFDICAGEAVPVARDFRCRVVDASAVDDEGTLIDVSDQVTCSIVVQPPDLPEVCGDGIVNLAAGETCDDSNTVDGDSCPSSCRIEHCSLPGSETVTASIVFSTSAPDLAVSGMTLLIDYPEAGVGIQGIGNDPLVQGRVTSASFGVTLNDLDYALRAVLIDPTFDGVLAGTALSVQFDVCSGATLPPANAFSCTVLDASDPDLAQVADQVDCSVMLP